MPQSDIRVRNLEYTVMQPRLKGIVIVPLALVISTHVAYAFVGGATGGNPGKTTAEVKVDLERGLIEPNENSDSWQDARWNVYTIALSHNFGRLGPLLDFHLRLGGSFFTSPAERNEQTTIAADICGGDVIGPGLCEFYARDTGGIASLAVGFNVIHTKKLLVGFSIESNIPISVHLRKFANPRIDYVAASVRLGVALSQHISYESNIYLGSGTFGDQNGRIALTQLATARWTFSSWKPALSFGPYVEADITERFDERYDRTYTPGYPDNQDRIRMARFGVILSPSVQIADRATVHATYLQKFFGYDAPATRLFQLGVSTSF